MHPTFFSLVRGTGRTLTAAATKRRRGNRARPGLEFLEDRLTPSTFVWTALGDGMTWNDAANWKQLGTFPPFQQPTTPTPYSDVVFPPIASLPKGSATTINFNFTYLYMPLNSLSINDAYTFTGNPLTIDQSLSLANPISAPPNATTATIALAGLKLAPGVAINTQTNTTLQLGITTAPTSLQLTFQGALTKSGGGRLVIDTQSVFYSNVATLQPIAVTLGGGSITLGTNVNLAGLNFQINSAGALVVADNVAATVQAITGTGLVDLEGTTAATDQTALTVAVPIGVTDQFRGFIDGIGQLVMGGNGTLSAGTIDFGGSGSIDVAYGTLEVDGSISAGALEIGPFSTLGGLGRWNFSGPVVFQPGSTFDVTLNGTSPGTQYTQLVDSDAAAGVNLGYATLAGSIGYQFEQTDQLAIVSAPLIQGAFQNVVAGRAILGSGVGFSVTSAGTSVTLAPLQSATTTGLQSSAIRSNPGLPVTFTASVATRTAPVSTGTVSFIEGTNVLATVALGGNGAASFTTTSLPLGSSAVTAVYNGAAGFLGSTSPTLNVSVVPSSTVTSIASSADPSLLGQPVTLAATVATAAGAPVTAGTVSFRRGSQLLGTVSLTIAGTANLAVSSFPVGKIAIQAVFNGSVNDLGSVSAVFKQTVNPLPTETSLTMSTETLPHRRIQYILVASVVPQMGTTLTPMGTVIFRKNGRALGRAKLSGGVAKLVVSQNVISGQSSLVATFQGSSQFGSSSSPPLRPQG